MASDPVNAHNQDILNILKPGDLVKFPRGWYTHWGVYEGKGYVINVSGSFEENILKHKAEVKCEEFLKVCDRDKAYVANEMDKDWLPLEVDDILRRAAANLGQWRYDLLFNNCEHFSKWCRYGRKTSDQRLLKMATDINQTHNLNVLKSLKPGDLVKFHRSVYTHWGVYEGDGHIIHLAGSFCEVEKKHKVEVKRDDFLHVAHGDKGCKGNDKDKDCVPSETEVIIKRAQNSIGLCSHSSIFKNCEQFAHWCRYGHPTNTKLDEYFRFNEEIEN